MNKAQLESSFSETTSTATTETPQIPIVNWERYNPLSLEEELTIYKGTWNSSQTLEENQKKLVKCFQDECCCFFQEHETLDLTTDMTYTKIRYKKLDQLEIEKICSTITNMSTDPMGCKLLRLLLTKYRSGQGFSKLYLVRGTEEGKGLQFRYAAGTIHPSFCIMTVSTLENGSSSIFATKRDYIRDNLVSGSKRSPCPNSRLVNVELFDGELYNYGDVNLFSCMLRWYHCIGGVSIGKQFCGNYETVDVITQRYTAIKGQLTLAQQAGLISHFDAENDTYRRLFGIMFNKTTGLLMMDPLNESAYLMSRYCTIGLGLFERKLSDLPLNLEVLFLDPELMSFYLDQQYKYPVFGVGQYQCSDMDPATGKKKI
jgi:hypothetical protein